ncbi:larval cuticle protein A3A-like [Atheta coriaria]|uniref:larval cuticle protein A3A-like n=1 Tax=Dalotia coriaria TaxID=877792 RepID=UPI0031F35745
MAFKFVAFAALLAVVNAGAPIGFHQAHPLATAAYSASPAIAYAASAPVAHYADAPVAHHAYAAPIAAYAAPVAKAVVAEAYDPHPQYSFAYGVEDPLTGDSKNQEEHRDGDVVQGSYSLTDSDGFRRTVQYSADPINGFNAVVHRQPLAVKVAKVAAPVAAYAAHAPLAYSSPAYYH